MGKRGPQPQPTALRVLRGNPGKRRVNRNEPDPPAGEPECPAILHGEALAEWTRVCADLASMKLLHTTDRVMLAQWCEAWAMYHDAVRALTKEPVIIKTPSGLAQNPRIAVKNKAAERLVRLCDRFGFAPSARVRLAQEGHQGEQSDALTILLSRREKEDDSNADR